MDFRVRLGRVRLVVVRRGEARFGLGIKAGQGTAVCDKVWLGTGFVAWLGGVWFGVVRCGEVRYGRFWCGYQGGSGHGGVRQGVVRYGFRGLVRRSLVWL
jgi:hypothetical protein